MITTSGWRAEEQNLRLESRGSETQAGEQRIISSGWRAENGDGVSLSID
jgi:hypothetical protein